MNKTPSEFLIFALAHHAFLEADALAEHLLAIGTPSDQTLFTACVTGIVTSYCRPFMGSNGLAGLPPEMRDFPTKELAVTHATVFEARHKFAAHFDRKHSEKLYGSAELSFAPSEVRFTIRTDGFAVTTSAATLTETSVKAVRTLCAFQMERVSDRLGKFAVEIRDREKRTGEFVYRVE